MYAPRARKIDMAQDWAASYKSIDKSTGGGGTTKFSFSKIFLCCEVAHLAIEIKSGFTYPKLHFSASQLSPTPLRWHSHLKYSESHTCRESARVEDLVSKSAFAHTLSLHTINTTQNSSLNNWIMQKVSYLFLLSLKWQVMLTNEKCSKHTMAIYITTKCIHGCTVIALWHEK